VLERDGDEILVTFTAPGRELRVRCAGTSDLLETTLADAHGRAVRRSSSRRTGRAWTRASLDDAFYADAAEVADWVGARRAEG
jgi:hypothetical protein